jgi:FkbM family methyltransferase
MFKIVKKHWTRLCRSLGRRWREWRLPKGYARLGTRYGGWWIDTRLISPDPLLIDCGLGEDISFPKAFSERFGGHIIGVECNPRSLRYCKANPISGMDILPRAMWTSTGQNLTFHLPKRDDRVSGSLVDSHEYVTGGDILSVETIDFPTLLQHAGRDECDILKLDIEGAEYEILASLIEKETLQMARQVLVEFHHGITHHLLEETLDMVERLSACGFSLVYIEGRNYIFRREQSR